MKFIGVDIGGTFTDVVFADTGAGEHPHRAHGPERARIRMRAHSPICFAVGAGVRGRR